MSNINRILKSELGRRIQKYVTDITYHRTLFTLPDVHRFQQSPVAFSQVENISEHFINEFVDFTGSDDGRMGGTYRSNKKLENVPLQLGLFWLELKLLLPILWYLDL